MDEQRREQPDPEHPGQGVAELFEGTTARAQKIRALLGRLDLCQRAREHKEKVAETVQISGRAQIGVRRILQRGYDTPQVRLGAPAHGATDMCLGGRDAAAG